MVVGVGIDLVERSRVARILELWGERFVRKIMGPGEASLLPAPGSERVERVALTIAAKEAGSKAIGTGWSGGVFWRDVEVVLGGTPHVVFHGRAAEAASRRGSSGANVTRFLSEGDLVLSVVRLLS
jgi:holo-[acyl-carrier protein] synthase